MTAGGSEAPDTSDDPTGHPLRAGEFSDWLTGLRRALAGEAVSDVPCGGCTACCRSSQFVHIEPDEHETLARIPAALLFPAPRRPEGHVLLGYKQNGHCPMLVDDRCSIYEHRPRTCRTYDCRVLAAAGIDVDDDDQPDVARQARRWEFTHRADADEARHEAVRAAARFVLEHREVLPDGAPAATGSQRAVIALRVHELFLRAEAGTGRIVVTEPAPEAVRVALGRRPVVRADRAPHGNPDP